MEQENLESLPAQPKQKSIILPILISILITVVVLMVAGYFLVNYATALKEENCAQRISDLEKQTKDLKNLNQKDTEQKSKSDLKEYKIRFIIDAEEGVGGASFKYPSGWDAIFSVFPPEGGLGNETVKFSVPYNDAEKNGMGIKTFNDLEVSFFWSISEPAYRESFMNEIEKSNCPGDDGYGVPYKEVMVGGKKGKEWNNIGGMGSNPTKICVRGKDYLVVILREKNMFSSEITDAEFNSLLLSFQFTE